MSLFPAYAADVQPGGSDSDDVGGPDSSPGEREMSPSTEQALLSEPPPVAPPAAAPRAAPAAFYLDRSQDRANLQLSTLYYPARPEYRTQPQTLGKVSRHLRFNKDGSEEKKRVRRYWRRAPPPPAPDDAADVAQRMRRALRLAPHDEDLWLRYIDFLEWCGPGDAETAAGAAADAAAEAAAVLPAARRLRTRLHAALRRALPPPDLARRLATMRVEENRPSVRAELWAREMSARACAGEPATARALLLAAGRDRAVQPYMPALTYVYGAALRSAGLWEELVQLVELSCAMNFPASGAFPPPPRPEREAEAERQLAAFEAAAAASGLPRGAVWARVEAARAALHWRAPPTSDPLRRAADPQCAPSPAATAELVAPAPDERTAFRLLVALLRLAETPLLPASDAAACGVAGGAGLGEVTLDWDSALLPALLRAARRLPNAHAARAALDTPALARRLVALTPMRATPLHDTTGFETWRRALWTAAIQWSGGRRRLALQCWRLRVLHARALLLDSHERSACVRTARAELRAWGALDGAGAADAAEAALLGALLARLEAAAGAQGDRPRRLLLRAARQLDGHTVDALFVARVMEELGETDASLWTSCCAVLCRPLPDDVDRPPPPQTVRDAATECERICEELESEYERAEGGEEDGESADDALLPAADEWAAARCRLRAARGLRAPPPPAAPPLAAAARRYWERAAAGRAALAARDHAAQLTAHAALPATPLNAYLALLSGGARVWERAAGGAGSALAPPPSELAALAALLPALLRALADDGPTAAAAAAERACARAARAAGAAGGAAAGAARVEAGAALGPRPLLRALQRAMHHAPHCKWLAVRGAAWGARDPTELAELCVERTLRLHALPAELD